MKQVKITSATYYKKEISGVYPFVKVLPWDKWCEREVYLRIMKDGKEVNVHANQADFEIEGSVDTTSMSDDALAAKIEKRFAVMEKLTDGVVAKNIRSLIISGAAGIGKSFSLEKKLENALIDGKVKKFTVRKGKISAIALFCELYKHSEKGQVLVLDDIDSIFQDEASLNLLKGALDTGDKRVLSWLSATSYLEEQGVEEEFEFNGVVCFVTNLNFDDMIERGSNLAPHFKALISRSIYLDLAVHTNREIMIRIEQLVANSTMLDVLGLHNGQKEEVMNWLRANRDNMRELSLRSVIKLAGFIKTDSEWRDMADITMLKGGFNN